MNNYYTDSDPTPPYGIQMNEGEKASFRAIRTLLDSLFPTPEWYDEDENN
jgi:hypothetical protein